LGKKPDAETGYFVGKIYYLLFFKSKINAETIKNLYLKDVWAPPAPKAKENQKTLNGFTCVNECTLNPTPDHTIPVNQSTGNAENDATMGKNIVEPSEVALQDEPAPTEEEIKESVEQGPAKVPPSDTVGCAIKASDDEYKDGITGREFRVSCPINCETYSDFAVYGNDCNYSDDSAVCRAAIHCGILPIGQPGELTMEIVNGKEK
jgi:hypothetical protein